MAEWSKAHAWKVCIRREGVSWVRIPLSPLKYDDYNFGNFKYYKLNKF